MLVCWADGTNDSSTKCLTFQVFFSYVISYRLRALTTLFYEKNKLKGFLQRILQDFMKKNDTWNIRRLVDESFVPSAQQTSVLYCRLTDFWCCLCFVFFPIRATRVIAGFNCSLLASYLVHRNSFDSFSTTDFSNFNSSFDLSTINIISRRWRS